MSLAEAPADPEGSAPRASLGVVAVGHAGWVRLIEVATGRVLWERPLAEEPGGSACDGQPVDVRLIAGIVLAGSMGHVFALALEDGSVLWHVDRRSRGAGETCLALERE